MKESNLKNMVILKNLPSNLVEEAIVILKSSKKVKKYEKIENKNKHNQNSEIKKEKDYILKEAEMLIQEYISKLEKETEQKTIKTIKDSKKYKRLKKYAYISSFIMIIQALTLIIK